MIKNYDTRNSLKSCNQIRSILLRLTFSLLLHTDLQLGKWLFRALGRQRSCHVIIAHQETISFQDPSPVISPPTYESFRNPPWDLPVAASTQNLTNPLRPTSPSISTRHNSPNQFRVRFLSSAWKGRKYGLGNFQNVTNFDPRNNSTPHYYTAFVILCFLI